MMRAMVWADSGAGVGLGHLGRCCAVAGALADCGVASLLLTPAAEGAVYARTQHVDAADASSFADAVAQHGAAADVLLIDSYRLRPADYDAARRCAPVLVIFDDEGGDVPRCDVVVNGAPGAERHPYARVGGTEYLLGSPYFPLRAEFRGAPARVAPAAVQQVLVTTGGDDVRRLRPLAGRAAREVYPEARLTVIAGAASERELPEMPGCEVVVAPPDYPARLRQADVIVCGSGQTLLEAAASGTPAAALLLAPDQRHQHAAMIEAGGCVNAGAWDQPGLEATLRAALEQLRAAPQRQALSDRARTLIDGRGAMRIADALVARAGAMRR